MAHNDKIRDSGPRSKSHIKFQNEEDDWSFSNVKHKFKSFYKG